MAHIPVLCIDGPSGSGKGTIAAQVREALGWHYLDSGAVYRLVALSALRAEVAFDDDAALVELVQQMDAGFDNGVTLNGEDVSTELRTETTGNAASKVAAVPAVREALLQWQRDFRQAPGIVADGRDMGTVVFPEADVKIFLTASAEERAERRYKQLKDKGLDVNLADLSREIRERDERDANRAVAPLKPADDAKVLDSTGVSIDDVVQTVLEAVKAAGL